MNFQNLMIQAQKVQKELAKKQEEFYKQEFSFDYKNKAVIVTIFGNGQLKNLQIDKTLIDPQDPLILQEMIVEAINSASKQVKEKLDAITNSLMPNGMGNLF